MRRALLSVLLVFGVGSSAATAGSGLPERLREAARAGPAAFETAVAEAREALARGCCFGEEAELARAIREPWRKSVDDPRLFSGLATLLHAVVPAASLQDPELLRELWLEVPLSRPDRGPSGWAAAISVLRYALVYPPAYREADKAVVRLLRSADDDPERLADVTALLGQLTANPRTAEALGRLSADVFAPLLRVPTRDIRQLPAIFAAIPSPAGTQLLLELAETVWPGSAVPAGHFDPVSVRLGAVGALQGRPLTREQLARLVRLMVREPELAEPVAGVVLRLEAPVPFPPADLLDPLASPLRRSDALCLAAARLLAAAGRPGGERLLAFWRDVLAGRAPDCGWDLTEALRTVAPVVWDELAALWRETGDPRVLALVGASGNAKLLAEVAARAESSEVRREATRRLRELAAAGTLDRGVRGILREVVSKDPDPWVRAGALAALLAASDRNTSQSLLADLAAGGERRARAVETLDALDVPLPDQVVDALLGVASGPADTLVRIRALSAPLEGEGPTERLARFEPRVRALLDDPDPEVRRAAAGWFGRVPAREPATASALLARTSDPDVYVRDAAAMALALAQAVPEGLIQRLEARIREGDPDENVLRKQRQARPALLRRDPAAVDRLLALVLGEEGTARERELLARGPAASPEVAQALLDRLAREPLEAWVAPRGGLLGALFSGEGDIEPGTLLEALVPRELLHPWLLRQARRGDADPEHQMRVLALAWAADPAERLAVGREILAEAARRGAPDREVVALALRTLGYDALRVLADTLWEDPRALERLAELLDRLRTESQLATIIGTAGGVPFTAPRMEDIPWIAARLAALEPGRETRRLGAFVRVARVREMLDWELRRAAFEAGILPDLWQHMADPRDCPVVADTVIALHHERGVLPAWRPPCP